MKEKMKTILSEHIKKNSGVDIELGFSESKSLNISAFRKQISSYSESSTSGVTARVLNNKKIGFSYSEKVSDSDISQVIDHAIGNSDYVPEDEYNEINRKAEKIDSTKYYNEDSSAVSLEEKKKFVLNLEQLCYDQDKRVINVPEASFIENSGKITMLNNQGLEKSEKVLVFMSYAYLMASDGKDTQVGLYFKGSRSLKDIDVNTIAEKAVENAVSMLGAVEPESGKYPVIFSNHVASELISAFLSIVRADEIQKGKSKLADKIGQKIGSSLFTVIDDPKKDGLNLSEFDAEGIDTKIITIFDQGVFKSPLYNLYTAKKDGVESNGRAAKTGLASPIVISAINPYLANGDKSEDQLFTQVSKGIYVTNAEGLHAGVDAVSGDFSLAAKGFMIENGKKSYPVKNFTISGNFYDLINDLSEKGNNRRMDDYISFSSPSILVSKLSISGK